MKLFWFCRIGSTDSFSRVSKNVLKELHKAGVELHTSINPMNLNDFEDYKHLFKNYILMGSSFKLNEDVITFQDFKLQNKSLNDLGQMMKYTLLQALAYCKEHSVERFMITMGNYELNWFMKNVKIMRKTAPYLFEHTKVLIYSPFDHIPSYEAIEFYIEADTVITTIPFSGSLPFTSMEVVGHANDSCFKRYTSFSKNIIMRILNGGLLLNSVKVEEDDVIILNANFYSKRKRIEASVDAVAEIMAKNPRVKLWLHNGKDVILSGIDKIPKDRLIITEPCTSNELNMIYNVCEFGLQTSWGEGWSLTNCEHAVCGGIQIVPDFLATGYHFQKGRGVLIPVTKEIMLNEDSKEVTIGPPSVKDTVESIERALSMTTQEKEKMINEFNNYFKYTWESESNKLINLLLK